MSKRSPFPNRQRIIDVRQELDIPAVMFDDLIRDVRRIMESWTEPERDPVAKVTTRSKAAAEMLIGALSDAGYPAGFHWHGGNGRYVVQFALHEDLLDLKQSANDFPQSPE